MFNVVVCDSQQYIINKIERMFMVAFPGYFAIHTTNYPRKLLDNKIINTAEIDVLLIDIEFEDCNGIDIAARIKNHNPNLQIIFISSDHKYAQDIFAVKPAYYIQKPIELPVFRAAINRAVFNLNQGDVEVFSFEKLGKVYRIPLNEIHYFESDKRIVRLYTVNRTIEFYGKLNDIHEMLDDRFIRCHQSYIVNIHSIKDLENRKIILKSGDKVLISQSRYTEVKKMCSNK